MPVILLCSTVNPGTHPHLLLTEVDQTHFYLVSTVGSQFLLFAPTHSLYVYAVTPH